MTKSTITRERIEQYANDPRMCNINDEIRQMARMALAAMDNEPVAYRWSYGGTTIWRLLDTKPGPGSNPRCPRVIEPLYRHAQPASVVLKDHQIRELVNQLRDIAIEYHGTQQLRERIARVLRSTMLNQK